jgi:MOSC domain-containing protein YiiM
MSTSASGLAHLLDAPMRAGEVAWIGIRPTRREPQQAVAAVFAEAGVGLRGDHYRSRRDGGRQVTLMQAEHLPAVASYLDRGDVDPGLLRRNLVVRGLNLLALKGRMFRIGRATLQYTGECHPCSRIEAALGPGGYNAMRGHGGITARITTSGEIGLGSAVTRLT